MEADGGSRRGNCRGFLGSSKCEKGAGIGSRGARGGSRHPFVEAGRGATRPRREERARGGCGMDSRGGCGRWETAPTGGAGLAAAESGAEARGNDRLAELGQPRKENGRRGG